MYPSLVGMGRLCGLEQELVLNGEKHMGLCVGSIRVVRELYGGYWFLLVRIVFMCLSSQSSKVF